MSETWYQTFSYGTRIEPVLVKSFTEHFVELVGRKRREARCAHYCCYFPTWIEARNHLVELAQTKLDTAKNNWDSAQAYWNEVAALVPPDSADNNGDAGR